MVYWLYTPTKVYSWSDPGSHDSRKSDHWYTRSSYQSDGINISSYLLVCHTMVHAGMQWWYPISTQNYFFIISGIASNQSGQSVEWSKFFIWILKVNSSGHRSTNQQVYISGYRPAAGIWVGRLIFYDRYQVSYTPILWYHGSLCSIIRVCCCTACTCWYWLVILGVLLIGLKIMQLGEWWWCDVMWLRCDDVDLMSSYIINK